MTRLYTVTISTEIVVAAEDATSAEKFAANIAYALESDDYRVMATPMTRLPEDWTMEHTPWGYHQVYEDQDRTIAEWIALGAAPEFQP